MEMALATIHGLPTMALASIVPLVVVPQGRSRLVPPTGTAMFRLHPSSGPSLTRVSGDQLRRVTNTMEVQIL